MARREEKSSLTNTVEGEKITGNVFQFRDLVGNVFIGTEHPVDAAATTLDALRWQVRDQWENEAAKRRLLQPRPLRLHWRTARDRLVSEHAGRVEGALATDVNDPRLAAARELVAAVGSGLRHKFVVLGAPGAGKSSLAVLYTLATIELTRTVEPTSPVPVLFSIAGWDPKEPIKMWFLRRVAEDYSGHDLKVVQRLLSDDRIMPVLDGLDEMPDDLLGPAMEALDRSPLRFVLTSRTEEYDRAIKAAGHTMSDAAVVEVQSVKPEDVETFFSQGEDAERNRWSFVAEQLKAGEHRPLAEAFSTPLMISLARRVYRRPTEPQQLANFATAKEITDHLLEHYLPTIYAEKRQQRWIEFLAYHLKEHQQNPNYEWWRLALAVPRTAITAPLIIVLLALGATTGACVELVMPFNHSVPPGFVFGALAGLLVGTGAATRAGRAVCPGRGAGQERDGVVREVLRDVASTITTLAVASSVMILVSAASDLRWTRFIVRNLRDDMPTSILLPGFAIVVVVALSHGLSRARTLQPRRSVPRLRRLPTALATGVGVAVVVSAAVALLMMISGTRVDGSDAVLFLGSMVLIALPVGLGRWLSSPAEISKSASPEPVLRSDRNVLLVSGAVCGVVAGVATWLLIYLFVGVEGSSDTVRLSWVIPVIVGLFVAVSVIVVSASAWLTYTLARLWLAATGRLPLRLSWFLRDAHEREMLHQTGATYQIRHEELREHLAGKARHSTGNTRSRGGSSRSRVHPLVGMMLGILLLAVALAVL